MGVSVPSSKSDADAEQVNELPVSTPVPGEMVTLETLGAELPTVTVDDVLETEEPFASVALAVHEIVLPGDTTEFVSCQVEPVLVEPFDEDQEYETPKAPSFTSVALAEHVSVVEVVIADDGLMLAFVIVGTVLTMVAALEVPEAPDVVPSDGVTVQVIVVPTDKFDTTNELPDPRLFPPLSDHP